jgi:hypothetical protein
VPSNGNARIFGPLRFMESEIELNDAVQELHVLATQSELYHVLVNVNGISLLTGLLTHENTDISIAVISLVQELTDVDTLTESEQQATFLIDALVRSVEQRRSKADVCVCSRLSSRLSRCWCKTWTGWMKMSRRKRMVFIIHSVRQREGRESYDDVLPSRSHRGKHDGISAHLMYRCVQARPIELFAQTFESESSTMKEQESKRVVPLD